MKIRLKSVNFGVAKTGLSTIGYTIYDTEGDVLVARSTSGVFEYGDTGIYAAKISLPERQEYRIIWDTGEASPRYAPDEDTSQIDFIQEETDRIRVIWNSMQNMGEIFATLIDKINKIAGIDNKKDFEAVLKEIKGIVIPKIPSLDEIKTALKVTVNPKINVPEVKIPDYSSQFQSLNNRLATVLNDVRINAKEAISKAEGNSKVIKDLINPLTSLLTNLQKVIEELKKDLDDVNTNISDKVKPADLLKDIFNILKQSEELRKVSEDYQKKARDLQISGIG
jgi:hypothetical protein